MILEGLQGLSRSMDQRRTEWAPKEAIQKFLDEYCDLDDAVAVKILKALNDEGNARTFVLLKPGSLRDKWLFELLPESLRDKALTLNGSSRDVAT
jgi:hypothetical protein